jgi:hypothetical protein
MIYANFRYSILYARSFFFFSFIFASTNYVAFVYIGFFYANFNKFGILGHKRF